MRKLLLAAAGLLLSVPAARAQAPAFGSTTPTSLPTVIGALFTSSAELSFSGSVDYTGQPTTLSGRTVVNGDLRLRTGSSLTVASGGTLYVYGNIFADAGALTISPGGHLYFYGDQWTGTTATTVGGGGTLHLISPRPAQGATADGGQRPNAPDGLAAGGGQRTVDAGGASWGLDVEHREASGLKLASDLAVTGTVTLATDAPVTLGSSTLTLDQRGGGAGTITGHSLQRYVQTDGTGQVQVLGLPAGNGFTFPVGAGASGDYTPLRVVNRAGSAQAYRASVTPTAPGTAPTNGVGRYWQLVAADASTPFDLTLEHQTAAAASGYNDASAGISGYAGGTWSSPGAPMAGTAPGTLSSSGAQAGTSDLTRTGLTNAIGTYFTKVTAQPLPVQLISFTAQHPTGAPTVHLRWVTASELNNQGFEVERSADGTGWSQVGYVPGAGSSSTARTYTLESLYVGAAYYRLRQVDTGGQGTYSPVRYVNADGSHVAFGVYPNPSAGELHLSGANPDLPTQIYSVTGQLVATLAAGQLDADLSQRLASGVYLVRQGTEQARLLIK